jgi:hypothetical protein
VVSKNASISCEKCGWGCAYCLALVYCGVLDNGIKKLPKSLTIVFDVLKNPELVILL